MKFVTLESGTLLAGVSNMLSLYGIDSTDAMIAKGMEAPYLLLLEEEGYVAGAGLFQPQYVNLYLHPRGFHMTQHSVPQAEVGAFLRSQRCALLTLNVAQGVRRMVVFSGYTNRKFEFITVKQRFSFEPDTLSLTAAALKARLDEEATVYTLEECPPAPVDSIALLVRTVENIWVFQKELADCPPRVSQEEFSVLDKRLFHPFMQDLLPVVGLLNDPMFLEEARLMQHDYRHLLIRDIGQEVLLRSKLPQESAILCLQYLHENVLDRLCELGASDELLEAYSHFSRR